MSQPKPLLFASEEMYRYSLGPQHPMGPDRVAAAMSLAKHFGVLEEFDIECPAPVNTSHLELVHNPDYIAATRAEVPSKRFGLGTDDNPISHGLSTVAARIAGGTLAAARAVWEGRAQRAVNLSGGLHHAFSDSMSGFCMYNDAAIAIRWLLANGAQRVVYLDLDAHHGDGVEKIFWDDPNVLTISVHESGLYLFPGTGYAHEIGGHGAEGTAVNVALPRGVNDEEWLQVIHAVVPPLLKKFRPDFIISQHGADPHRSDPLADLELTIDAMARAYRSVAVWAQQFAGGRWVALGGGGYQVDAVARAWTQVLAAVADVELAASERMPNGWEGSSTLGDEGACAAIGGFDPTKVMAEMPHAALVQTTRAVFPYWGLPAYG